MKQLTLLIISSFLLFGSFAIPLHENTQLSQKSIEQTQAAKVKILIDRSINGFDLVGTIELMASK